MIDAITKEKVDIRDSAMFLISHLMTMRQGGYHGLITPGVLNDVHFRSIQDIVNKETRFIIDLAEKTEGCYILLA